MKTIIIAGGTGLVGKKLDDYLTKKGYSVKILTRNPEKYSSDKYYKWDLETGYIDKNIFPADIVINLSGEGIADKLWTEERKQKLIKSRVESSKLLKRETQKHQNSLAQYISASAIGYYGDSGPQLIDEEGSQGNDFLAEVSSIWEDASMEWKSFAKTVTVFRIGIVLSSNGGALQKMTIPMKFGISNYFGNGNQIYSWIHIDDLVAMIYFGTVKDLNGIFNAVSPNSVSNKEFAMTLKGLSRFALLLPVPKFVLKAAMGEMSSILLNSNNVSSEKIVSLGFDFKYGALEVALKSLIN